MNNRTKKLSDLGFALFPLSPLSKIPMKGTKGFKDASHDEGTIDGWFSGGGNNIGIATGSQSGNIMVVDLDYKHNGTDVDGIANWEDYLLANGIDAPHTATVETPTGGRHLYFRLPDGVEIRNTASVIGAGIDTRGEGGYVVAPGSMVPQGQYRWITTPEEAGIAELPVEIMELLLSNQTSTRRQVTLEEATSMLGGRKAPVTSGNGEPSGIQAGGRNDKLFRKAIGMMHDGTAYETALQMIDILNKCECKPPLSGDEVLRIVRSAYGYEPEEKEDDSIIDINGVKLEAQMSGKKKVAIKNVSNVVNILGQDALLAGRIGFDERAMQIAVKDKLPWDRDGMEYPRPWITADDSNLLAYIDRVYKINALSYYSHGLTAYSSNERFNPIAEYLDSLEWDGVDRVSTLLHDCLGAEQSDYTAEAMRLFLREAYWRAKKPGCKADYCLLLGGPQGLGKSTFIRMLAHRDNWANDNFNSLNTEGSVAYERLAGSWFVEMAEMLCIRKSSAIEAFKAFVTSTCDKFRAPYARFAEDHPRACVFALTTNQEVYLSDMTGNRRFLPIECGKEPATISMFDGKFEEYINQVWAQIAAQEDGAPLLLSKDGEAAREKLFDNHAEEDPRLGAITDWLDKHRYERVTVPQIMEEALGIFDPVNQPRYLSTDIHNMIAGIDGWSRLDNKDKGRIRTAKYGRQVAYVYSEEPTVEEIIEEAESLLGI